eukprot:COSAG06_NODE_916_length_11564_cov_7.148190_10_plen_58_part_00
MSSTLTYIRTYSSYSLPLLLLIVLARSHSAQDQPVGSQSSCMAFTQLSSALVVLEIL